MKNQAGKILLAAFIFLSLGLGTTARAETPSQSIQIAQLMQLIAQLQAQLAQMQVGGSGNGQCIQLSRALFLGVSDNETEGDVSKLQQFLTKTGHYTFGKPTGFFGPATQIALQSWQKSNGIVSSGSPETTGYGVTGPSTRSTMARGCSFVATAPVAEVESADSSITLTSPKRGVVFNKNKANDDIVLRWTVKDLPKDTNVLYEITSVESFAGAFVTGSAGQLKAESGSSEHRIAIDIPGTLDAGEYKVRLSLQKCHSLGCNVSYPAGPLNENLETFDRSSFGYFTIINSDRASVNLIPVGRGDADEIDADINDSLEFNYYPTGDIDECVITAKYNGGENSVEHPWPNTILSGQFGRATFPVVATFPLTILEEVEVECMNSKGKVIASESIEINVDNNTKSNYQIIVDGKVESGKNLTEAETRSRCLKKFNDNRGKRVQCSWDGNEFFDDTNWKG